MADATPTGTETSDRRRTRRPTAYDRVLAYWVSHGPAIIAISLMLSHADPKHAQAYQDLAILAASLLGGTTAPPTLNGHGLGKLANKIAASRRADEEESNATNTSQ